MMTDKCKIPAEEGVDAPGVKPLCCVDNEGTVAIVYRGNLVFTVYDLVQ